MFVCVCVCVRVHACVCLKDAYADFLRSVQSDTEKLQNKVRFKKEVAF